MHYLPFGAPLASYAAQADALLRGWRARDPDAVRLMRNNLPRFLDERVPWLPRELSEAELFAEELGTDDAQLAVARWYSFRDWRALVDWLTAIAEPSSLVARFEFSVEAVVSGDTAELERLLREDPGLVRARSTIVTHHHPPMHRATLLHYVAANGVEGWRQRTPANAVDVAKLLLRAGAEPDALAEAYGGGWTTMGLLVSSAHPAAAGLQVALAETLLDFGASVEGVSSDPWSTPLMTALAFGYLETAQALVRRGARVTNVAAAAGLGLCAEAEQLLPAADALGRHKALALAAQHGHTAVVELLLDAGEDPNRYNPQGNHAHSTPLHQAAWSGHLETVQLLVRRGARLDIRDTIHHGTPLGWAEYGGRGAIAEYLRAITASTPAQ